MPPTIHFSVRRKSLAIPPLSIEQDSQRELLRVAQVRQRDDPERIVGGGQVDLGLPVRGVRVVASALAELLIAAA